MKRSEAFPSKYLSKDDVETPLVASIKIVRREVIGEGENEETKTTMYFHGEVKPLILNNANWMTCEDLYGEDSDMWIGKAIELYVDKTVMYGGKRVGGVRIRKPATNGNGTKLAAGDAATAFWAFAYQHEINKIDATAYLTEAQNDFARALELMKAQSEAA